MNRKLFLGAGVGALVLALVGLMTLNAWAQDHPPPQKCSGCQGIVSVHLGF